MSAEQRLQLADIDDEAWTQRTDSMQRLREQLDHVTQPDWAGSLPDEMRRRLSELEQNWLQLMEASSGCVLRGSERSPSEQQVQQEKHQQAAAENSEMIRS
uniref:DUF2630 family protein n=1 Tax=Macrostomum lignano TaxID=282301 RepID=A0A1I8F819_9PLAT